MIAVIADDFTGAAELGGIGWRHGLSAELADWSALRRIPVNEPDLLCVNTDSRNCRPPVAAARAAAVARALRKRGVARIYKKVDSVLRGPVAAELEAVRRALGLKRALLVPANPSAGRVVVAGRYLIHGTPLDQTDFRFDPEHPRLTALVKALLGGNGALPIELRPRRSPANTLPDAGIIVGEAARPADVRHWAGVLDDATLPAGAAEFFGAWLESLGFRRALSAAVSACRGRTLFVCGSASAGTREFVRAARASGVPVFSLPARGGRLGRRMMARQQARIEKALCDRGCAVLASPSASLRDRRRARRLPQQLAAAGAALVTRGCAERICAEGGATAAALAARLRWRRLRVVGELAPGVVALAPGRAATPVLVVKPGSYRWPESVRTGALSELA